MKITRSVIIDAPIQSVWEQVRRFDGVARWNPGVTSATLESGSATATGSIRRLEIVDGSVFRETLLVHSDLEYSYTYDILESPLPCHNYVSTHRFIEITDGNRTLGIWEGSFDCDPKDESELEQIVGTVIYHDAQIALNLYMQEQKND